MNNALLAGALCLVGRAAASPAPPADLRGYDFKKHLLGEEMLRGCPEQVKQLCAGRTDTDYCPAGLSLTVRYGDVIGDGGEEAIVEGSSCETGTAGPDIHRVYALKPDGSVAELPVPEPDTKAYDVLFGNRNYGLSAEKGGLVASWTDTSDRRDPLKIRYKWDGAKLRIAAIEAAGTYKTSYDCAAAKEEHERAICAVRSLAELDVELGQAYRQAKDKLTSPQQKDLIKEQNAWIAE